MTAPTVDLVSLLEWHVAGRHALLNPYLRPSLASRGLSSARACASAGSGGSRPTGSRAPVRSRWAVHP